MKKRVFMKSILILLPVLAVGLATTGNSVVVFDSLAGTTQYFSYFDLLPVESLQLVTVLAAILCLVAGILAVVCVITKKDRLMNSVMWISFVATIIAVIPVIMKGDIKVAPNVGVPIFMFLEYGLAYSLAKNAEKEAERQPVPRLKRR